MDEENKKSRIIQLKKDKEIKTEECPICCFELTDPLLIVRCNKCQQIYCRDCLKRYLLVTNLDTKCMHCSNIYNIDFILLNVDSEWYKNNYEKYRKELLWNKEILIIKDISTQKQFETYNNAIKYCKEKKISTHTKYINEIRHNVNKSHTKIFNLRSIIDNLIKKNNQKREEFNQINSEVIKNNKKKIERRNQLIKNLIDDQQKINEEIIIHQKKLDEEEIISNDNINYLNCLLCLDELGKGWENFDFESGKLKVIINNSSEFSCPATKCYGVVFDGVCNLCKSNVCHKCREIIYNNSHECNPEILESIQIILANSVKCPKCYIYISKISGCDQMFCTQCHTTFSWTTGNIITGIIHNPHYFEWLLKNNKFNNPVRLNDNNCNTYISYNELISCFTNKEFEESYYARKNLFSLSKDYTDKFPLVGYYIIAFVNLRQIILDVRATSGNHVNINYPNFPKLRFKLLSNQISEEEFKEKYYEEDFNYNKSLYYWEIYSTVTDISSILFDNLYSYTHFIQYRKIIKKSREDFYHETYIQIQKLLEYANIQIEYYNKAFGEDERLIMYKRHPFVYN